MGKRLIGSVGLAPGSDSGFDLDTKGQIHGYSTTQYALDVGDNDQVLTADSTTASGLKWADSGGSGIWTADGTDFSTSGKSALTVSSMTGRDITQVLFRVANDGTNAVLWLRVNNVSGTNYNTRWGTTDPSNTNSTGDSSWLLSESLANQDYLGEVLIFKPDSNLNYTGVTMRSSVTAINGGAGLPYQAIYGGGNNTDTSAVTRIDLLCSSGNILGEVQVNSMDYQ